MPSVFADLRAVAPEVFVLAALSVILVVDLFLDDARRAVTYWLTQAALLGCSLVILAGFRAASPAPAFSGMVVHDMLADTLKLFTCVSVAIGLAYSRGYLALRGLFRGEFYLLALFSTLGMMVMVSAASFLTVYLGLELMSLSLYAMVALDRDSRTSIEAAMKYFILGALASGMLLYGMSMIYGATGALGLRQVFAALEGAGPDRVLAIFGLVFVVSGIAFKLGIVPYHMWVPDVYQGAPTAVTLFVGTAPELAGFAFAVRLLAGGMQPLAPDWQAMVAVLAVLSVIIGNVIAIAQTNIKRMLAYSAIANMGFMMIGVAAGSADGYSAAMFYTVTYVLTTLAGFGVLLLLSRSGFEADLLDDFRGLNARSPWYAFVMLLVMFSLAGVPPVVGFYAKFAVLEAAVSEGMVWLAVAAVIASVVGAFYYLRVVKLMYFDTADDHHPIEARADARALLSVNGVALLLLGVLPQPLMELCAISLGMSVR